MKIYKKTDQCKHNELRKYFVFTFSDIQIRTTIQYINIIINVEHTHFLIPTQDCEFPSRLVKRQSEIKMHIPKSFTLNV
jgi:hypothetical protein